MLSAGRRAAVVGAPVGHSLSPSLHRAAYRALGLTGWSYEAVQVDAGSLRAFVAGLGPEWAGLSVTMPLKEEALALADEVDEDARLTGGANTLVRCPDRGWRAWNTDVHGVGAALAEAGVVGPRRAAVLGGGATARSVLVALDRLGVRDVDLVVREAPRAATRELLDRLGLRATTRRLGTPATGEAPEVVVSTLPATAVLGVCVVRDLLAEARPVVLDVAYAPWPSGFATAVSAVTAGRQPVVRGTAMLLHQAARQVHLMTGHDGPVEAMRAALTEDASTGPAAGAGGAGDV
ncbi:shikimate dehydrogenase [uncultured Ornithinimicrobium sp.]|uniref:shikimate dehydrogenase n=1 Tax=uncultured Ornithinimicrobium sp. TaxID=259307 RepID=UPI0025995FFF|nr:shikimate dehydrogenase [uncultured Ornithinimicrobium sp.]